jgi:hypothetical protein
MMELIVEDPAGERRLLSQNRFHLQGKTCRLEAGPGKSLAFATSLKFRCSAAATECASMSSLLLFLIASAGVSAGTASGPQFTKVVHLGGLEQVAYGHVDSLARGCLARAAQKLLQEKLLFLLFGQTGHGTSSDICAAEASPRLCDPPCSEKQAGIGPISQKPELVTMD